MGISYTVVLGSLASEMASHQAQRQDRTPSVASVLLGLTQNDGNWVTTEMPAENREAIMNDRSAMLVHHGLKQPKSDVVTALATSAITWRAPAPAFFAKGYMACACACFLLKRLHGVRLRLLSSQTATWRAPARRPSA